MELQDIFTTILSLIAVIISITSYFQNSKNQKRELRLEKLEEIIEIIHTLAGNYHYFEDTYFIKTDFLANNLDEAKKNQYQNQITELIKTSEEIDLRKKISRLYVLNNSYLPNGKLFAKISVYISIYTSIAEHTLSKPFYSAELPFNEFPKRWDFLEISENILKSLVREMDLGYKNNISYSHSYEEEFKQKYNL